MTELWDTFTPMFEDLARCQQISNNAWTSNKPHRLVCEEFELFKHQFPSILCADILEFKLKTFVLILPQRAICFFHSLVEISLVETGLNWCSSPV